MKIKIDNNSDALYIYIQEKNNKVKDTIIADEFYNLKGMINFDIDFSGNIVGIEIVSLKLIYDINEIKLDLNDNNINLIFSNKNEDKNIKIYNDNIIVGLDIKGNITFINIKNIIDMTNIKNNLLLEVY